MKTTTEGRYIEALNAYEAARLAIEEGTRKGLSQRTMDKRYKALFAAEDAMKTEVSEWR